jgi:fermentation-respiration switch protein FrsA (DUF1100 family)
MSSITGTVGSLAAFYLVFAGGLFFLQRSLLYLPDRTPPDPAVLGLANTEVVTLDSEDGLKLAHWYHPPADGEAPVVVVFHGNAGNIGHRVPRYSYVAAAGIGVFLMEYRGYGGNPGKPSEAAITADARAVLDYLGARGVRPDRIVLYGESLGCAVAIKMAAERPVAGVILESPYTSIAEVAQSHYWYLPAKWLVLDKWDAAARISQVSAPLLAIHGERDKIIPFRYGRRLFELAPGPKASLFLPASGHNDLYDDPAVPARVLSFIEDVTEAEAREGAAD